MKKEDKDDYQYLLKWSLPSRRHVSFNTRVRYYERDR